MDPRLTMWTTFEHSDSERNRDRGGGGDMGSSTPHSRDRGSDMNSSSWRSQRPGSLTQSLPMSQARGSGSGDYDDEKASDTLSLEPPKSFCECLFVVALASSRESTKAEGSFGAFIAVAKTAFPSIIEVSDTHRI